MSETRFGAPRENMKLQDKFIIKATGQEARVCGFADESKLPKRGEPFAESVASDFNRGVGVPNQFEQYFWPPPSKTAVFCEWPANDDNHPLRLQQIERGRYHGGWVHKWFEPSELEKVGE